ncbi:MAG: hypothetical protein QF590_01895 [Dehalococcoidia bacterium]|nr:hypothetical protein [Dehalococcoidia bacterium]
MDTVFDPPVWDVFSTVIATNQILVIDGGRIADLGTNEEFLERSEFYRRLYEEQFTVIPSLS